MRERRYVKFKLDIYDDTKTKIIDQKPERDFIHYFFARSIILAGKTDKEGDLYMAEDIPYTIDTLAIEFNRGEEQIKLALDVFMELEMLELTDGSVYRVKNFAKHQNIKVKEKIRSEDKQHNIKNIESDIKEALKNEVCDNEEKESGDKADENEATDIRNNNKRDLKINSSKIDKSNNESSEKINNSSKDNMPILLKPKKNKKGNNKQRKAAVFDITDEEGVEDNVIDCFYDGEIPLGEGEEVVWARAF